MTAGLPKMSEQNRQRPTYLTAPDDCSKQEADVCGGDDAVSMPRLDLAKDLWPWWGPDGAGDSSVCWLFSTARSIHTKKEPHSWAPVLTSNASMQAPCFEIGCWRALNVCSSHDQAHCSCMTPLGPLAQELVLWRPTGRDGPIAAMLLLCQRLKQASRPFMR